MSRRAPILLVLLLVVVTMTIAVGLYPIDCDAAFAVHDGIWYAEQAEGRGLASVNPHHPLFHVLVLSFLQPLRALGVAHPGHVAIRIVAGLGGAWLLVQICALAGRRRLLVGAAFALMILCTRGFLVEMASGENVLPAAAAGLFALTLAARPNTSLLATGAALTLAGLLRQDNVFVAPGVAWAVAAGLPAGTRVRGLVKLAAGALAATLAGYGLAWMVSAGPNESVREWLFRLGLEGSWTGPKALELSRFPVYCFSIVLTITGRIAPVTQDQPLLGLLYVALILAPGLMLRGTTPFLRLGLPVVITLIGRACFHTWFEADNFEWLVMPVALVAAFASGLCRGEPATSLPWRWSGVALLLALTAWLLLAHGPSTWRLRERRFMTYVEEVANVDRTKWRFLVWGAREAEALYLLNFKAYDDKGPPEGTYKDITIKAANDQEVLGRLAGELTRHPVPTIVIADRFVMDGMPATERAGAWPWFIDDPGYRVPGLEIVRRDGRAYAARWTPPAESSPAAGSRK